VSGIHLRAAMAADAPRLIALDREIFGWYGADEDPAVICARLAVFPAGCVVLEADDVVIGYGLSEKWSIMRAPALDEDPCVTHDPNGRIFCITTLAVQPNHHGRGLGALLLGRLVSIAQAEECRTIVLETAHAVGFYRRHGFQQVDQRTQRGISLTIMARRLCVQSRSNVG